MKKRPKRASWTVPEFCQRNGFSRSHFYRFLDRGEGPRIFKVGASTRISAKAERDWLATREEIEILYPRGKRLQRLQRRRVALSNRRSRSWGRDDGEQADNFEAW